MCTNQLTKTARYTCSSGISNFAHKRAAAASAIPQANVQLQRQRFRRQTCSCSVNDSADKRAAAASAIPQANVQLQRQRFRRDGFMPKLNYGMRREISKCKSKDSLEHFVEKKDYATLSFLKKICTSAAEISRNRRILSSLHK
ncbi:unnamed protein product [Dracunculus medinensis]|uniref:Pentatricopeptide repeat-containing protein n=1 Tax=Dracunculus medinensis TaxID=318479 RepID=A0A0N4UEY6_DRAME|nr:unnamed protein product [Dracunculus medinensis]